MASPENPTKPSLLAGAPLLGVGSVNKEQSLGGGASDMAPKVALLRSLSLLLVIGDGVIGIALLLLFEPRTVMRSSNRLLGDTPPAAAPAPAVLALPNGLLGLLLPLDDAASPKPALAILPLPKPPAAVEAAVPGGGNDDAAPPLVLVFALAFALALVVLAVPKGLAAALVLPCYIVVSSVYNANKIK